MFAYLKKFSNCCLLNKQHVQKQKMFLKVIAKQKQIIYKILKIQTNYELCYC
jgi:hypothetical protein